MGWRIVSVMQQLLSFALDDQRYGLPLAAIERVVRVVEITPLPQAPDIVLGLINMHGRFVPVADIRRRFGLSGRPPRPSDHLIIARQRLRPIALLVDRVEGAVSCPETDRVASGEILPGLTYVAGVGKLPDGTILIHDLDQFLSLREEALLDRALAVNEAESDGA